MVDHIADEVDQMILGQPFTQARRKQKPLFWKVRTVALAHDPLCTTAVPVPPAQSLLSTVGLSQTHLTSPTDYFSDTLLAQFRDPSLSLWQSAIDETIRDANPSWTLRPSLSGADEA